MFKSINNIFIAAAICAGAFVNSINATNSLIRLYADSDSIEIFQPRELEEYKKYLSCYSSDIPNVVAASLNNSVSRSSILPTSFGVLIEGPENSDKPFFSKVLAANLDSDLFSINLPVFLDEFKEKSSDNISKILKCLNKSNQRKSMVFIEGLNSNSIRNSNLFESCINRIETRLKRRNLNNIILIDSLESSYNLPFNIKDYVWPNNINLNNFNQNQKKLFTACLLKDNNIKFSDQDIDIVAENNKDLSNIELKKVVIGLVNECIKRNQFKLSSSIINSSDQEYQRFYLYSLNKFKKLFRIPKVVFSELSEGINKEIKSVIEQLEDSFTSDPKIKRETSPFSNLLLYGCPGTGKSTLAEAIAQKLDRIFIKVTIGSLTSTFRGSEAIFIEALFNAIYLQPRPVVVCLDDIDAFNGNILNMILGQINQMKEQSLSQQKPIIIATTNYLDSISCQFQDSFKLVEVKSPGKEERGKIIKYFIKNIDHNLSDSEVNTLAEKTNFWGIRDLQYLCHKAWAIHKNQINKAIDSGLIDEFEPLYDMKFVHLDDFEKAYSKIKVTVDRKNSFCNIYNQCINKK